MYRFEKRSLINDRYLRDGERETDCNQVKPSQTLDLIIEVSILA
ncbi:hypothetical protein [Novipirellula artificiosorum]|nr:hypothetical protein [Novipirellula artificiosorum]